MYRSRHQSFRFDVLISRHRPAVLGLLAAAMHLSLSIAPAAASGDVVLYSSNVSTISGGWKRVSDSAAAGGQKMVSSDSGWSRTGGALASPSQYFEANFSASSGTAYRVWLRLKAAGNSVSNDSVYVQFSDAINGSGGALWRIGSTSGLLVSLERCSGCGVSGWGWRGGSWWTTETAIVRFPSTGTKTLRVQTREDGVAIDQIVLSPVTYYSKSPGASVNDSTIVSKTTTTSTSTSTTTVKAIPGTIQAEDFDNGSSGSTYWDATAGNSGGAYRSTNVDIERANEGGYNIGYTARGEWLQYTVSVAKSATYTLKARVASYGTGGTFRVEFDGVNKTGSITIPNTGGWQTWQTVSKSFSLGSGQKRMRVVFENTGPNGAIGNLNYISLVESTTTSTTSPSTTPTGSKVRMMTWNIYQGRTKYGSYDLNGQVQVMANSGAHVIMLQEVSTWNEDQPSKYKNALQSATGKTWYSAFGPSSSGGCLGTLILSQYPISSAAAKVFYGTGVAKGVITVNGVPITLGVVHLEYYDTSKRTSQLYAFMDYMRQFNGPTIAAGDFNSWWGEWWIKHMETESTDTWKDVTGSPENGYTLNNVRFDYQFRAKYNNWRIKPTAAWVISTDRSDHRPMVADYYVQ